MNSPVTQRVFLAGASGVIGQRLIPDSLRRLHREDLAGGVRAFAPTGVVTIID
jgi:thioester reductase-like protein